MKLLKFLKQTLTSDLVNTSFELDRNAIDIIKKDCAPYFAEYKKAFTEPFYRTVIEKYRPERGEGVKLHSHTTYRIPYDSSVKLHRYTNKILKEMFGWYVRNGVFAWKKDHGTGHIFLPIGELQYVWSPAIHDLYSDVIIKVMYGDKELNDTDKSYIDKNMSTYTDKGINKVGFQEVSFNCDEYYLLNIPNATFKELFK